MTDAIFDRPETVRLSPDADGIAQAAALILAGQTVAFPTETVYGLGADATQAEAVARIFEAKNRPSFNPLIVHVPDMEAARDWVTFPDWAEVLADAFWPGALTLALPKRAELPGIVTAGHDTLAIRVPSTPVAQDLLRAVGRPVAAPSANPSGRISPTTADHVLDGLDGRIAAVLDGGACAVGVESTIIGGPEPTLLRPGGVSVEAIEAALGRPVLRAAAHDDEAPLVPGQLTSHYAPGAAVRLNATAARPGEVLLGFGPIKGDLSLSAKGDLIEAAAALFSALRRLDETGRPIAVAPIPIDGIGEAINDRLMRAAAPRD